MKIFAILIAIVGLISCGNNKNTGNQISEQPLQDERIEILYFHGKQRCITCNAIENITKEVVEKDFAQQLKDGRIIFNVIDISTKEGEKVADNYEVTWSSLYINNWKEGKEIRKNMTDFGFSYAKNSPDIFREGVKKEIEQLLK